MTASRKIRERIEQAPERWVFTPFDFMDLGASQLVGMVLLSLMREGRIRRVARGVYDIPKTHPKLGVLVPSVDGIAQAIARRHGAKLQPSEAEAANLLNLSEQVPAKIEYETDGPSRTVRIGKLTIRMRHRPRRKLGLPSPNSSLVFAGLRNIGRSHITEARVRHLREIMPEPERRQLLADLKFAPAWMRPFVRYIARETDSAPKEEPRNKVRAYKRKQAS